MVNGNTANRKGEYFWYGLSTPNSSQAWYGSVNVNSTYPPGQSESGNIFVPKTPELFDYDLDGNLTNDGRWFYTWDGENRLVKMEPSGTVTPPTGSRRKLEFAYDHQSRRIWQKITNLDTSEVKERVFVYDGWNLIATLNPQLSTLNTFVWGLDLSGSFQGAGGVGGLLKVTYKGAQTTNCFAAFDGNGNVLGLIDAANSGLVARYEYGPFGEVLRATGPMAKANPFRFSTKFQDDETDLLYYGYRFYSATIGRWLSKDPAGEPAGGRNLYCVLGNDPIAHIDTLGLMRWADVKSKQRDIESQVSNIKCCCDKPIRYKYHLSGYSRVTYPSGAPGMDANSITGYIVLDSSPDEVACVYATFFYWWTCYDAVKEGPDNSRNQGWSAGSDSFSGSYSPSWLNQVTQVNWPFDPFHLAMNSVVIVVGCFGGNMHAVIMSTDELVWDWAKPAGGWVGPRTNTTE
jgi:RHS repeat-associated protein